MNSHERPACPTDSFWAQRGLLLADLPIEELLERLERRAPLMHKALGEADKNMTELAAELERIWPRYQKLRGDVDDLIAELERAGRTYSKFLTCALALAGLSPRRHQRKEREDHHG